MFRSVLPLLLILAGFLLSGSHARADGDPGNGEAAFQQCDACHDVGGDARNRTGPVLNNIVGRRAATRSGYIYSRGMREAGSEGLVWTQEALDAYITNPRRFVRGTRMAFAGIRDEQIRADIIAYLLTLKFDDTADDRVYP